MATIKKPNQKPQIYGVYMKSMLTKRIALSINQVGKNIKRNLENMISKSTEGRCIAEGFIKPNSVKVLTYSSGDVAGDQITFETVFECMICYPVEGMLIECTVKTITKAGIHAEVTDEDGIIPLTIFVARDHQYNDKAFGQAKENTKVTVRVIGIRFELNDPFICVIAKLMENQQLEQKRPITIQED
uniref:S1 motif domain-containing protein n=1 Tax=viral metagenome TaxID=1070528 RepID=A0A6C0B8B5_9ZZZZ